MSIAEKNRIFLAKLRSLPDHKKKIILWTIVAIIGIIMGIFWIKGTINSLSKIGESTKSINLPKIDLPSIDILQNTTPSNK